MTKEAHETTSVDPAAAFEEILSKDLLKLSFKDRNNIQEEIHGVRCLAPEETPRLLEDSLRKLAIEIDEVIPDSQKQAYLRGLERPVSAAYINGRDFRLRFLRTELFDHKKAARRLVKVCEYLLRLFGTYALERPIQISDFTNAELKVIRKGRVQILPFRDRSGRRIAIIFPGAEFMKEEESDNRNRVRELQMKIFIYMSYVIGSDTESQRSGIVFIVWFETKLGTSASPDVRRIHTGLRSHQIAMVRASAIHICSPDTPFYRLQRSLLLLGIGSNRSRLRIHLGEYFEITDSQLSTPFSALS